MRPLEIVILTGKVLGVFAALVAIIGFLAYWMGNSESLSDRGQRHALQQVRIAYEQGRGIDLPKDERGGWAATLGFEKGRPGDLTYANMQLLPERK